jgi:endonuclease YncB( thermonuclease family)
MLKPLQFANYPSALSTKTSFGPYRAVVVDVTDGDTITVLVDTGFGSYRIEQIRIRNINAPELDSLDREERKRAEEARKYLQTILPLNTPVVIYTYKVGRSNNEKRSFNRYVADVEITGNRSVAALMLNAGFAKQTLIDVDKVIS